MCVVLTVVSLGTAEHIESHDQKQLSQFDHGEWVVDFQSSADQRSLNWAWKMGQWMIPWVEVVVKLDDEAVQFASSMSPLFVGVKTYPRSPWEDHLG